MATILYSSRAHHALPFEPSVPEIRQLARQLAGRVRWFGLQDTVLGLQASSPHCLWGPQTNPSSRPLPKREFIAANPITMQALVNAFYKTLKWIATATTDEIVDTVPSDFFLGDRAIYVKALKANLLVYSKTGIITRQGMNSALNMLATFDPDLKGAKIDLQRTFDDRFIRRATVLFDDPTNSDLENDERRPEVDLKAFRD